VTVRPHRNADVREGGIWHFDIVGIFEVSIQRFASQMRFIQIVPKERNVAEYGTSDPADSGRFRLTVTFDEQTGGKTILTLRQLHPGSQRRKEIIGFGAVDYGL
jgi:uncharacterized protein YndB with AHSA1/START domain